MDEIDAMARKLASLALCRRRMPWRRVAGHCALPDEIESQPQNPVNDLTTEN